MSNFHDHLDLRSSRYKTFCTTEQFLENLIGLHHVELNIVENCTRKCSFCPRYNPSSYPNIKEYMKISTLDIFIERVLESSYTEEIHLTGFGEPLMHPNIIDVIIKLRQQLTNYISLTTNGDLFDRYNPSKLYEAGISNITVSCYDGPDHYDRILTYFKDVPSSTFFIRKLWKDDKEANFLAQNSFTIRHPDLAEIKKSPCYIPFYKLFIDYDGKILLCSNDWYRKHNLNLNINTQSLMEIWFSEEIQNTRKLLLNSERTKPACQTCQIPGTLVGSESANIHKNILL